MRTRRHRTDLPPFLLPVFSKDMYTASGVHSVNEALRATAFVDAIRFFTRLVLNADEANL